MKKVLLTILILLLLIGSCIIGGFLGNKFFQFEKNIENKVKNNKSNTSNKTNKSDDYKEIEVDSLITDLYNSVISPTFCVDDVMYKSKGMKVEEFSERYKNLIASNSYNNMIINENTGNNVKYIVEEKYVKYGYEKVFGKGSYTSGQKIATLCQSNFKYDSEKKIYTEEGGGCGGTCVTIVRTSIVKTLKNSKNLKIVVANAFLEPEMNGDVVTGKDLIYKDIDKKYLIGEEKEVLGEEFVNEMYKTDSLQKYVDNNKDNLQQYTYTFELDDNGFYKYIGFERTKEE